MAEPLLALEGVAKRYPYRAGALRQVVGHVAAVRDVSVTLAAGEIVGLVGESGCGKSTLARLIVQLERPDVGSIRYNGQVLGNGARLSRDVRRDIQLVFQDPANSLNPTQRVGSVIAEPLIIHRLATTRAQQAAAVEQLLGQVGLPANYARRYPRELSGGERQRVAIARALALKPKLLVLDEPVASLDVSVGAQVLDLLRRLQQEAQLTYLVISHDLRVIGSLCRRVAVMYLGRIVEDAPAEQLFRTPAHPYTELLLESAGLRQAGVEDRGEVPSPLHPPSGCAFRTRCVLAQPRCADEDPRLQADAAGRRVACHFRP